jgi:assimilatory nitrate reductase catalytic subunit
MRLVVIDPRETASAREAHLHLPIRADGDTALFLGALAAIEAAGAIDRTYTQAHTEGLDAALEAARPFADLARLADATGLDTDRLAAFLDLYARTPRTVTVYSQGVNQSAGGTDKVSAILNCHLATARIGRAGMGPFSVTGQPNAMGGREVGGLANQLAAHMDLGNTAHADLVRRFWQAPTVAQTPGLKAVDLFQAVSNGRVRALWIMGTNPVDSLPQADGVAEALRRCPFIVVSDVVTDTDTMPFAHVALPSAAWGEKDGTVTNSERRISRQRGFLALPGDARPDWWQLAEVARRLGFGTAFDYPNAAAIFREHAALSAFENAGTRDFDIGALATLDDAAFETLAPTQWPRPADGGACAHFFADGRFFTPNGRARLAAVAPAERPAVTSAHPFVLNTGRIRDQWHTMTRTGRSARLSAHLAEPFCEIHPADAMRLGIAEADLVAVSTDHGSATLRALLTTRVAPGTLFAPMHWTGQFSGTARINALVPARTDPASGQPASKAVPAAVERVSAAWYGFAVSRQELATGDLLYWAKARAPGGWRVELAGNGPAPEPHALLGLDPASDLLDYTDRGGDRRLAAFDDAGRLLAALWLSPAPVAVSRSFAASLLDAPAFERQARAGILAGRPGTERPDPGALVCSCFGVGANDIRRAVGGGCASVAAVGQSLRAGTNCGSCRTEIQGLIDAERRVLEPS